MQTLTPGTFLQHGAYRIERMLGQGGFGITYLATDVNLQRMVAVKEFFPKDYCEREDTTSHVTLGTRNTAEFVNRLKAKFLKEARNIAKLNHPGIIRIYSAFEENNTAYYVMEYIEGDSLSAMVKRGGPLPPSRALRYIDEVGDALAYVHGLRINHLDVKPANIMVRRSDDTPILIDFGLSKQYDSEGNQTSTTPTGISHGYAPMEQYNDGGVKDFSPQTDLYSLAATLYYILSGVVPPQSTRLIDEQLTFPAGISAALVPPISKAMSVGRKDRHETVRRFLSELGGTDDGDTTIGPAPDPAPQPVPTPAPEPDTWEDPDDDSYQEDAGSGSAKKWIMIVAAVLAVGLGLFFWSGNDDTPGNDDEKADTVHPVTDMVWKSPLGGSVYTGEVLDSLGLGVNMLPHGRGVARITEGAFAGSSYDGNFVSGAMEGQSTYTLQNGDVFTGTFHRNQFEEGKYLDKASGEYFEGMFRDMQPYKGKWYSAEGKMLEEI